MPKEGHMIKLSIVGLALMLSACNAHSLRQILVSAPEPELAPSYSRIQFNCTENGFYIFEGFPDIVKAHPIMTVDEQSANNLGEGTPVNNSSDLSTPAPCQAALSL